MGARATGTVASIAARVAFWALLVFLLAIVGALTITIWSVAAPGEEVAVLVVAPLIVLTVLFLYYEGQGTSWSFVGAAVLGIFGVALRLIISTQPSLEVGGGLPAEVTGAYVALGLALVLTSLWAYLTIRRDQKRTGDSSAF